MDIRHAIGLQRQAIVETTHRLQKLSDVAEKQKEYEAKKQDAEYRLKIFKQHGVEDKLQKQVDFEQDARATKDSERTSSPHTFRSSMISLADMPTIFRAGGNMFPNKTPSFSRR